MIPGIIKVDQGRGKWSLLWIRLSVKFPVTKVERLESRLVWLKLEGSF